MAFEFSDEHEELRRTVRQFFENESDETKVRELMASERGFEDATWKQSRLLPPKPCMLYWWTRAAQRG